MRVLGDELETPPVARDVGQELEEALLTDGTELNGSSLLQELIVRLLSGCLGHNGISTSNYQMFLRRLFRIKCKEQGRENPFNSDIDFQFLPLKSKVEILHVLCDFRLDADDVIDVLKNLDSDSLRVHPLGYDDNKSAYWYFYGTRLYREDYPKRKKKRDNDKQKTKRKRKDDSSSEDGQMEEDETGWPPPLGSWQVLCYTEEDWRKLAQSIAHSTCKEERALYQVLSEDFLPEIPRLFEEKERLQRKRLLENQPRRQSRRIEKLKSQKDATPAPSLSTESKTNAKSRQERDKERAKRRKGRAEKGRRRRSASDTNSESESSLTNVLPSGRQTNNSLASATGEIYIKPQHSQKLRNTLFKRTHEDLMTGLYKILDRVKAHDDAWPFRVPVDEKCAPRYYAVIARPMDLQTMEDKLDNAEYGSLMDFRADFQLIVDNCRQYNGSGNEYTDMAKRLQARFEACAERFFEAEPSSDEGCPLLRRAFPQLGEEFHDESLDSSSLTPIDRPLSLRSGWSRSHSSLSGASIIMSEDGGSSPVSPESAADPEQRPPRRWSRQWRRRKADRPTDTASSRSDSRPPQQRRDTLAPSREASCDRSAKTKPPPNSRRSNADLARDKPAVPVNDDDDDVERSRPKINYKEDDTSDSEVLSESSDDSFAACHKLKTKGGVVKKVVRRPGVIKNPELVEELDRVTAEVLQVITSMLEDSPRFSDFSSNSNSPFHTPSYVVDDMATMEGEFRRRLSSHNRPRDRFSNEAHRRRMYKEQLGIKRKREIQRTIDRLQPGKSKGNLLSKEKARGADEGVEGGEAKTAEGADVGAPQISLGKVLETGVLGFGIGDSVIKEGETVEVLPEESTTTTTTTTATTAAETKDEVADNPKEKESELTTVKQEDVKVDEVSGKTKEKPTPNLSAWFKAFGAPKPNNAVKKKVEIEDGKAESRLKDDEAVEDDKKALSTDQSIRRTRRTSTGSSVSERSSFSQEPMDGNSPRPSLDEPYQSPQQELKAYHHSPINGTIKVGFYQDTCFPRGSSDKSGSSPRDLPSVSPREMPSPRYCSPRNTPVGLREYPSASPRTSHSRSPRLDYNADLMMRREYQPRDFPKTARPREYVSPASPREYCPVSPQEYSNPASPREYCRDYPTPPTPRDYRDAVSPQYPSTMSEVREQQPPPRTDFQAFETPRSPQAPIYAGVPSYPSHLYFEANKQAAELRANLEKPPPSVYPVKKRAYTEVAAASPKHEAAYKGGSFTPTRGAMEQDRTFTPTPGRLPGPSTTPSLPIGLPHHPLQQHLIDQYAAEEERRISSPFYPTEYPNPQTQFGPQYIGRGAVSQSPINYSSAVKNPSPTPPNKDNTVLNHHPPKVSTSSAMVFASSRLEDMLQEQVGSQFNRPLTELPHFPTGQDLAKLPLHPSDLQHYTQMANLGFNYHQMIPGKGPPVYNHPMQELMQSKAAAVAAAQFAAIPGPYGRSDKEREVPFTPRPPPPQQSKPVEKPPKKSRKKKVEPSGFQQYVGPADAPGSAFNYGPPPATSAPALKDGYGPGAAPTFLDQPSYYEGPSPPTQTSATKPPPPPFFLGRGGAGTGGYPSHHPLITQAQYQEYLVHHGVLPPTPGYPAPAYLGLHSPMNRPSWL